MESGKTSSRLPNEVLLIVTGHLHGDPNALWTLLFVNRFFFHASVPLLYADPFKFVQRYNQHKLEALIVASFIHAQRRFSESRSSASSRQLFTAEDLLSGFELGIVAGLSFSSLLQDATRGVSPTTINYAESLTVEPAWRDIGTWIHLMLRSKPSPAESLAAMYDIHGNEIRLRPPLNTSLTTRLGALFLQCYPENIATLSFDVSDSSWYLPLADKFGRLKVVHLRRSNNMTDKHVEDTVTFLIINRTAFSRKRPVQIEFGPEWDTLHITTPRDLTPEGRRDFLRKQQRPRIDLYKAIGNPVHMNATQCPWFYEDITEGMDLESLETFVDVDHYRSKYREISDQQVFLQRCHNLRELQISVSDPLLFSLVVENQSTRVSSKLQELDIRLCYGSVPLEDAMEAYGQSLRNVKISVDAPIGYGDPSKPLVFGDWTLPFVNTIDIEVHSKAVVCIKDFSHCHSLEELSVTFADKTRSPIISKHICLPAHRAPVWKKLSHLKTLKLYGGAAFQFDFDSLDHCSDLETLILDTCLEEDRSVFVPEYQASFCHQIGSHVLSNNELVAFDQTGQQCKCHRHFPKLRTLILKGSPSSAFCLTWLQGCPALETIELAAHGTVGFKFLLCSCNTCILSSKEPQTEIRPATLQIQPCIESKLTSIKIAGPCEFSGKALLTLLTIYAPNVIELHMDMIRNNPGTSKLDVASHGGRILEVLTNAEYINHIRDQREPTRVRSDKFKYFSCAYSLPKGDKNKLGLLFINHCEMDKYLDAGKVVFNMNTQCYIRKQDKM